MEGLYMCSVYCKNQMIVNKFFGIRGSFIFNCQLLINALITVVLRI